MSTTCMRCTEAPREETADHDLSVEVRPFVSALEDVGCLLFCSEKVWRLDTSADDASPLCQLHISIELLLKKIELLLQLPPPTLNSSEVL